METIVISLPKQFETAQVRTSPHGTPFATFNLDFPTLKLRIHRAEQAKDVSHPN